MNTEVRVSFQIRVFVFSGYMPRSGMAVSYSNSIFSFLGTPFFHSGCIIYTPTNGVGGLLFFILYPAFIICKLFDDSHPDWGEMIPHFRFDLHFCNNLHLLMYM